MAHDFCWWLDSAGRLWPLFHFWRDHAERDPQGRWSFAQVTGTSVEDATDAWLAWVKGKAAAR